MKKRNERKTGKVHTKKSDPDDRLVGTPADARMHVRERPDVLFAPPPFIVETVLFSRIGHTFGPMPTFPGSPARYIVQDFVLDQTGASGCDGKMQATKLFDLTTATSYRFNIYPKDRAKRIKVVPPDSVEVFIGLDVGRRFVNAASDVADQYAPVTFFDNLTGVSPSFTYNAFSIGRSTNHWIHFVIQARCMEEFAFMGLATIGTYPMRSFDPGTKSYIPYSTSLPFNLPGSNSVPCLLFSYLTEKSVDPGAFVFLS